MKIVAFELSTLAVKEIIDERTLLEIDTLKATE